MLLYSKTATVAVLKMMSMNQVSNSLTELAARIRAEHEATLAAMNVALKHAMSAGDLLIEAKAQLNHGEWQPWIREHCGISDRTARLYMQLARNREEIEAQADITYLTLNGAVRLLAPPAESQDGIEDEQQPENQAVEEVDQQLDEEQLVTRLNQAWDKVQQGLRDEAEGQRIMEEAQGLLEEGQKLLAEAQRQITIGQELQAEGRELQAKGRELQTDEVTHPTAVTATMEEQINGFISRLNNLWSDLQAWGQDTTNMDHEGRRAVISTLYTVANEIMKLAQYLDGR
jgi:hypothetical protein